ncbi:protein of unknown function [Burkholderia multivorans]
MKDQQIPGAEALTQLASILASEIECSVFERHVAPALEVARAVLAESPALQSAPAPADERAALYTMDQMRDYALAFHQSRLDAHGDQEAGQGIFSPFNACMYRGECRARAASANETGAEAWKYCPECGCDDFEHTGHDNGRFCSNCGQEWFPDIDYARVVKKHLSEWFSSPAQAAEAVAIPTVDDMFALLQWAVKEIPATLATEFWKVTPLQIAWVVGMLRKTAATQPPAPAATQEPCAHDYVRADSICTECGAPAATPASDRIADATEMVLTDEQAAEFADWLRFVNEKRLEDRIEIVRAIEREVLAAHPPQPVADDAAVPCQGKNCSCTDGKSHSPECIAEHDAAVRGDERAAFEAAWARTYDGPGEFLLRHHTLADQYANHDTQRAWEGWQARAAAAQTVANGDARPAFEWPPLPVFPESFAHVAGHAYFTEHQMQGYANAYGEAVRKAAVQAGATEPAGLLVTDVLLVWDVFSGNEWWATMVSPTNWDAKSVHDRLVQQGYSADLDIRLRNRISEGNPVAVLSVEVERLRALLASHPTNQPDTVRLDDHEWLNGKCVKCGEAGPGGEVTDDDKLCAERYRWLRDESDDFDWLNGGDWDILGTTEGAVFDAIVDEARGAVPFDAARAGESR